MIILKNKVNWNVVKGLYFNSEHALLDDFFIKERGLSEDQYLLIVGKTNITVGWESEKQILKELFLIEKQIGMPRTEAHNII